MTEALSERQQRAVERLSEDESLTEDLTDEPARALLKWASEQASALAGDAARSDEQVSEALKELRKAVRAAAASGETDGAKLVDQAATALAKAIKPAAESSTSGAEHTKPTFAGKTEQAVSANKDDHIQSTSMNRVGSVEQVQEASDKEPKQHSREAEQVNPQAQLTDHSKDQHGEQHNHKEDKRLLQPLRVPDPPPPKAPLDTQAATPTDNEVSEEMRYQLWLDDIMEED